MKYFFSSILLFFTIISFSQEFSTEILKDLKPRNIGPGGMSGRVTAIDVVNNDTNIMYVGTASGGLWKSTSKGVKWDPIFDKEATASIGSVAIQQSNPSVIWVGTGEGNPRNSLNGGYGIYKSIDGGKNWILMGLEKTRHIHRIVVDPTNPDIVYAGAIGSPWGEHPERGVFKTTDGGKTWNKILFTNNKSGVADLVMDPKNPNKLIAAMWEHKRDPWFFKSGGEGSGLYITHNGGDTWEKRTEKDGLPKGELGRIGLAIADNKPNIVYALIESKKNALYKSEDGGFKFKKINEKEDIGNRPFYYSDIFVDPQNENRVYSVFTYVNVSEDGGKNFQQLMPAYGSDHGVHPDHHAWWIHPTDPNFMIDGNDGGLNITYDGGNSWRFVGNLPVAQFYHIAVDNEFPYNVYGGMQDNGSWRGPAYIWKDQGIRNDYWQEITFGDGFDVVPDRDDSRYGWSMSQQGYVSRYDYLTGNNYIVRPTHPNPDIELRFNWNSAINIDPFNNSTLYFGSQYVHKSLDKGLTWEVISPDLTTNDPEKQKQSESGGLSLDATGAENYTTILVIEPSPLQKDLIWVGTDDGRVQITQNGGQTWSDVAPNLNGLPDGSWITQIKASNKNKGEALLVANDYRRFNYTPYAYRTRDYGKTWQRIVGEKDAESYALSIVEDPIEKNLLFLGTDDGLYFSLNAGTKWTKFTNGFPTVSVKDLVIHPRENDLVIGTFGRAAWVLDDIKPLREMAKNNFLNEDIKVFEPSTAYLASYQQPSGSRFGADAVYSGENRKSGAMIRYYIKKKPVDTLKTTSEENVSGKKKKDTKNSKKKKDVKDEPLPKGEDKIPDELEEDSEKTDSIEGKGKKGDSIYLKIYDQQRLIRTLKTKTPDSTGIYNWHWNMDEAGVDRPSRKIRESKNEPRGTTVKPGSYRAEIAYNGATSSTMVKIESDPRLPVSEKAIKDGYDASKKLEKMTEIAANAVKQLVESKNSIEELNSKFKKSEVDSTSTASKNYKKEIKMGKGVIKQIDSIIALYIGKEDKRQGITRNKENTVMDRIGNASFYSESRPNGLTLTENTLISHAEKQLKEVIETTNTFFETEWKEYKKEINALEISRFKETETFNFDN